MYGRVFNHSIMMHSQGKRVQMHYRTRDWLSENSNLGIFPATDPAILHLVREYAGRIKPTHQLFCVACLRGLAKTKGRGHRNMHIKDRDDLPTVARDAWTQSWRKRLNPDAGAFLKLQLRRHRSQLCLGLIRYNIGLVSHHACGAAA